MGINVYLVTKQDILNTVVGIFGDFTVAVNYIKAHFSPESLLNYNIGKENVTITLQDGTEFLVRQFLIIEEPGTRNLLNEGNNLS